MINDEKLLGFDARDVSPRRKVDWTDHRRNMYLLREDVESPLSTDLAVWPRATVVAGKSPQLLSWTGLDLWSNLEDLEAAMAERAESAEPAWIIAVTLDFSSLTGPEREIWSPRLPVSSMGREAPSWNLMGYDISDLALLSGLSNCGYAPEHLRSLREDWGWRLNDFHLFRERSDALLFKELSNKRVPEHSPFFIYGLYLIDRRGSR
jgi:hypothetical protein